MVDVLCFLVGNAGAGFRSQRLECRMEVVSVDTQSNSLGKDCSGCALDRLFQDASALLPLTGLISRTG